MDESMYFDVGFTGTQDGMTDKQMATVLTLLGTMVEAARAVTKRSFKMRFRHGDCVGADEQAHSIAKRVGAVVTIHPPIVVAKRAFCDTADGDTVLPEKEYIVRNHDIVDKSQIMLAAPKGMVELARSGTWATVRYAQKLARPLIIVWPDGSITRANHE